MKKNNYPEDTFITGTKVILAKFPITITTTAILTPNHYYLHIATAIVFAEVSSTIPLSMFDLISLYFFLILFHRLNFSILS
jgi:hypothetical protein